jgi:2,4-dienoyl-CoA reductase-like NADH-dependent reductase (Old Yellow Enzyme family)
MSDTVLSKPLQLPCGSVLPNRLAKAAMSEHLAEWNNLPGAHLRRLYRRWSIGRTGLLISGNVMIDRVSMESVRNVALEEGDDLEPFRRWAAAGRASGSRFWLQLNHPGRQTPRQINPEPVGPSAAEPVDLFRAVKAFAAPRALDDEEIEAIIARFATAAKLTREAGFDGVQIHAAHGYLISQFLSPLTNRREDRWGGSLENRARFLRSVVRAVREAVGDELAVGIKMNSADFQRGGFSHEESMRVARMLEADGLDLIEISGGSYESQAMFQMGEGQDSSRQREAYFLEYARDIRAQTSIPLMVTGGFRRATTMRGALEDGACDLIGLARPLSGEPDLSAQILAGHSEGASTEIRSFGMSGKFDFFSEGGWSSYQLARMARGKEPNVKASTAASLLMNMGYMLGDGCRLAVDRLRKAPVSLDG